MSMQNKPHPKAAGSYLTIGDPYDKKAEQDGRLKGKQLMTTIPKGGQTEGYFTRLTYAPEPFSDEAIKANQNRQKRMTGFGSSDANKRDEFTYTIRTQQVRENALKEQQYARLHGERTARIREAEGTTGYIDALTDKRDELEELEVMYQANLRAPHIFQTKVPSLYDIGRATGAGVTPFCNKCSKDTFYCVHRVGGGSVNARRLGPVKLSSQQVGSGDVLAVIKPQYGLKGDIKEFFDRSHLEVGSLETDGSPNIFLMKIGSTANVKTSAGSIAHAIRRGQLPTIVVARAHSINQAVKSLSIARSFLAQENTDLVVVGNPRDRLDKQRLTLRAYPTEPTVMDEHEQEGDLRASQSTNPNHLSGAIAKTVRAGEYPRVLCIGAEAVTIGCIATIQARRFLEPDNIKIGFKPQFVHIKVDDFEDKTAVCLTIVPTDF